MSGEVPDLSGLTPNQQVRAAICAVQAAGLGNETWRAWAEGWLSGKDRTSEAASDAWSASRHICVASLGAAWAAEAAEWAGLLGLPGVDRAEAAHQVEWASGRALHWAQHHAPTLDLDAIVARAVADEVDAA